MQHRAARSMRDEETRNDSAPSVIQRGIEDRSAADTLGLDMRAQPDKEQKKSPKKISLDVSVDDVYIAVNDALSGNFSIDEWDPITIETDQFLSLYPSEGERNQEAGSDLTKLALKSHDPYFFVSIITTDGKRHAVTFDPKKHDKIVIQAPRQTVADAGLDLAKASDVSKISQTSWGETSGIYPSSENLYDPSKWDAQVTQALLKARAGMETIAGRNSKLRKDTPNLKKALIKRLATYHLKDNFPGTDSEILGNKNVKYFYISPDPDARHTGLNDTQRIVKRYGPFYNVGGGDVARGKCYIIFYEATN